MYANNVQNAIHQRLILAFKTHQTMRKPCIREHESGCRPFVDGAVNVSSIVYTWNHLKLQAQSQHMDFSIVHMDFSIVQRTYSSSRFVARLRLTANDCPNVAI